MGRWFFLSFREGIIDNYNPLFTGGVSSDGTPNSEESFGKKWGWYQSIYALARGDVGKFESITKLNVHQCMMWLEFEKEKNELEAERIKKAYK